MAWNLFNPPPRGVHGLIMTELGRLERDHAQGTLSRDAFIGALAGVRDLAYRREIRPLHTRALRAALAGVLLMAAWAGAEYAFPEVADALGAWPELLAVLGIAALLASIGLLGASFLREAEDFRWFEGLQRKLQSGGRLMDYLEEGARSTARKGKA
ncbi:hypothetical protein [Mesoterricola silvestris]|uniref:Uncharacterized protein n=1 Tax=Mesoterricola silvestris TaxID=2927979 RepID=A0AA48GTV7_9BACT|nr:hypothetical protein [Mesoterricola silvestris]BDU71671.1 hypothetical protein METEAL_08450 [Mesoterricola silvestris]